MKPILNKSMLRQATIDSSSLATMSSIIHIIAEQGEYRGVVYRGEEKVGKFALKAIDYKEKSQADQAPPLQTNIDLSALDNSSGANGDKGSQSFTLRTGGHVVFYVSADSKEYAVEVFRLEKQKEPIKVFDSRVLGHGDIFIAQVMRPGSYAIRNVKGKGNANLTVEYPKREKLTLKTNPVMVECNNGTMNPSEVKVQSVQALMFNCIQESRITIELKKAEDRPRPDLVPANLAAMREKEKTGGTGRKEILRKIRFFG
jgi:hypothetical protein